MDNIGTIYDGDVVDDGRLDMAVRPKSMQPVIFFQNESGWASKILIFYNNSSVKSWAKQVVDTNTSVHNAQVEDIDNDQSTI